MVLYNMSMMSVVGVRVVEFPSLALKASPSALNSQTFV